jgi:hypothetical protein
LSCEIICGSKIFIALPIESTFARRDNQMPLSDCPVCKQCKHSRCGCLDDPHQSSSLFFGFVTVGRDISMKMTLARLMKLRKYDLEPLL